MTQSYSITDRKSGMSSWMGLSEASDLLHNVVTITSSDQGMLEVTVLTPYNAPMRTLILRARRALPRSHRLERAAFAAVAAAVAALPLDEGPTFLFSVPLGLAILLDLSRWLRTGSWPFRHCVLDRPVVLLTLVAVASLLWAESPHHTRMLLWRDGGRWVAMLYLVLTHASTVGRLRALCFAMATGAVVCSLVGVVERLHYLHVEQYRVFGTFGHPNHCANFLSASLILVLALPGAGRKGLLWRLLLIPPLLFTLFFTLSRSAWIGTITGLGVLGLLRNRRLLVGGAAMLAGVVILAFILPSTYIGERIRGLVMPGRFIQALHHRPEIWEGSWRLIKESPVLGHGYGHKNFHYAWKRLPDRPDAQYGAAHNTPLHILFELGVVGLLLHLWIYGRLLLRLIIGYRTAADPMVRSLLAAVLAISAGWILQSITMEHILLEQMMVIIGTVAGLGLAAAGLKCRDTG